MKTEQEQIKAIKQIIDERVETTLGYVQGRHGNVIKTVDTIIIARDIVEAGYGDVKQAQIDVLNKLRRRSWQGYQIGMYIVSTQEIDELIEEVKDETK
jgi:hypothetical protein